MEPTVCTKGSQASCGVWREDSGLDSRPCRKRRPHRQLERGDLECARAGCNRLADALTCGEFDVVIADEINCAMACGLLKESDLLALADRRPKGVELVFTGRGATDAILERADLVTEMRPIKHYYQDKGLPARTGIEM